jgi:hypothetical protein
VKAEPKSYRGWPLLDTLPEGWAIDRTAGSPVCGYEFCTNGQGVLSGRQERALVRSGQTETPKPAAKLRALSPKPSRSIEKCKGQAAGEYPAKTVNQLAREKFKARLLSDILIDLKVCEIEGWSKAEYIGELRKLINGIGACND